MPPPPIPDLLEAVIFDMDGTLLDTERLQHDAMGAAAEALGCPMAPALLEAMIGVHRDRNAAMLRDTLGPDFPIDAFYAASDDRFEALARDGVPLRPGVAALLDHLHAEGLRCALATSTSSPEAEERLTRAGLIHHFDAVVTRSDVAHPKPAPDPYLLAAKRLGVDPARCLAIEDSPNGIRSAAAAGMATIMIPDLLPATDETRGLTTATLVSLVDVIDALAAARRGDQEKPRIGPIASTQTRSAP